MSRIFKFRAWDKIHNIWIYFNMKKDLIKGLKHSDKLLYYEFTGFKDSNNKEIYEGDIVDFGGHYGTVYWYKGTGGFFIHRHNAEGEVEEEVLINDYKIKVIGNIFENKTLLRDLTDE